MSAAPVTRQVVVALLAAAAVLAEGSWVTAATAHSLIAVIAGAAVSVVFAAAAFTIALLLACACAQSPRPAAVQTGRP